MKRFILFLTMITLAISLNGCKHSIDSTWDSGSTDSEFVVGAVPDSTVCVHEKGVFFFSNTGKLSYYDYDSMQSYVLCSKPNCFHLDQDCIANANSDAVGFAMYGDYAYYFRPSEGSLRWELVQIDIQEQTLKVLIEFGNGTSNLDEWTISNIDSAYYSNGKVWVKLHMLFNPSEPNEWSNNGMQLIAIDLETGDLTEITQPLMLDRDCCMLDFHFFGNGCVGYEKSYFNPPYMTMKEYTSDSGKEVVDFKEYEEYLNQFYANETRYACYRLVDTDTMEQTTFREGIHFKNGTLNYNFEDGGYTPLQWIYDDNMVVMNMDVNGNDECYIALDAAGNYKDTLLEIESGGALGWYHGAPTLRLYNGDSLLYLRYDGDSRCKVYQYSLKLKESTFLFDDIAEVSFRIEGQTSDKLIGKINKSSQYAWIYKEDYEKGAFDKLHEFNPS